MEIRFAPVPLAEIEPQLRAHLAAQPGRIEAFLEEHIAASQAYRIVLDGAAAGFAAIHERRLITLFALDPDHRHHGQAAFRALRRLEEVTSAFVPTCDEFYLAHALDDYRELRKQAYVFAARPALPPLPDPARYAQTPLTAADAAWLRAQTGDFFDPLDARIARGELVATLRDGERAGVGIVERSRFYPDVASVGMFTLPAARQSGVGTATIRLLIELVRREGRRAVAGCWYYNHASKRTLERAGMAASTRLLRVEY